MMMTKTKPARKFVLSGTQFDELVANPVLATAVFNAFKSDSSMTTNEAFKFARLMMAQYSLEMPSPTSDAGDVKINLDTGEIIDPKQPPREEKPGPEGTSKSSGVKRTVPA